MDYYFDSSALAKQYVAEAGTSWVRDLFHPAHGNQITTVRITAVEVIAALTRRARLGTLVPEQVRLVIARFRIDYEARLQLLEVTELLVALAMTLAERHGLRGYDSMQLAAALSAHRLRAAAGASAITFVSADVRLNAAAAEEGLAVDDPNDHL